MTKSEKTSICIILGSAHGADTKGKQSPDGSLKEFQWSREMCTKVQKQLQEDGYRCVIDSLDTNEIGLANRVQICTNYGSYFGHKNCLYFSIHVNAAGSDGQWKKAQGWESHIAKNASDRSKRIANILWEEMEKREFKMRRPTKTQNYWSSDFFVLRKTYCPAVLVETLFQDNKEDVKYLLSKEGKDKICEGYVAALERYVDEIIENGSSK